MIFLEEKKKDLPPTTATSNYCLCQLQRVACLSLKGVISECYSYCIYNGNIKY